MARERPAALGAGAVVLLLMVAAVVPAPHALLWPDTVRDLSASLALARGAELPLRGPPVNFGPHLGPAWIWLQAPILVVAPTLAAASVYVAIVGAFKFGLLFLLGRLLGGWRLGLCFAIAATAPSIAVYQWHVFWHPNWVEAAIVGSVAILVVALRRASISLVYASAAVLGLAVQLHVTALFYAPLHLYAIARLGARGPHLSLHAFGLLAAVAAWFAPVLFATASPHGAELQAGAERIGAGLSAFSIADVATVVRTAYVEVPLAIGETYAGRAGIAPGAWMAILGVLYAVPIAGLALELATNRDGRRRLLAALLAALAAGWIITTAVRTYTSFYLAYFLLPLSAVAAGFGLERVMTARTPLRYAGHAALAATVAAFVASSAGAWRVGASGFIESRLPLLQDLRHPAEGVAAARWVGASARDAMARFACARHGAITLHGEWAYAVAGSTGLDFRLHCPAHASRVRILGPADPGAGWTLIADGEARRLGRKPPLHLRRMAAFAVRSAKNPPQARAIEPDWHHFEQLRDGRALGRTSLSFETGPGEAVMIVRLKPFTSRWENVRVERDGVAARAVFATYNSEVFTTPGPSRARWRIDFDTDAPQWVDVHVF